jgi:hypothetical protein
LVYHPAVRNPFFTHPAVAGWLRHHRIGKRLGMQIPHDLDPRILLDPLSEPNLRDGDLLLRGGDRTSGLSVFSAKAEAAARRFLFPCLTAYLMR